jgi:NAD(P)-dependent dehydrogenase (short-subunit alcohol dehydrogenase family)
VREARPAGALTIRFNDNVPSTRSFDVRQHRAAGRFAFAAFLGTARHEFVVAALVFFLLFDESRFTTGQTIVASGGRVMLP